MNHSFQRCEEATVQLCSSSNILKIMSCQPVCKKTHFTPTRTHMNLKLDLWLTPCSLNGCCMYKSMYAASRGRGCWLTHCSRTLGHLHLWRCRNNPRQCFPQWNWAPDILMCFSTLPVQMFRAADRFFVLFLEVWCSFDRSLDVYLTRSNSSGTTAACGCLCVAVWVKSTGWWWAVCTRARMSKDKLK